MNESTNQRSVRSYALDALETEYKALDTVDAAVVLALVKRLREANGLFDRVRELERLLSLIESGKDARGYELSLSGSQGIARYALKGNSSSSACAEDAAPKSSSL